MNRSYMWSVAALLLFASCSNSYLVKSDFLTESDFTQYSTFAMLENDHGFIERADPINMQRIDTAIRNELRAIGYEEVEEPQLEVFWYVKVDYRSEPHYYRDQYNRWDNDHHWEVVQYKEGTLVIDLIDCASNKVVWHGRTSDRIYDGMKKVDEKIDKAVKDMVGRYSKDAGLIREVSE